MKAYHPFIAQAHATPTSVASLKADRPTPLRGQSAGGAGAGKGAPLPRQSWQIRFDLPYNFGWARTLNRGGSFWRDNFFVIGFEASDWGQKVPRKR